MSSGGLVDLVRARKYEQALNHPDFVVDHPQTATGLALVRLLVELCAQRQKDQRGMRAQLAQATAEEKVLRTQVLELLRVGAAQAPARYSRPQAREYGSCQPDPTIVVRFLGDFVFEIHGHRVARCDGSRPFEVLRYLAASAPRPIHKELLAEQFWPDFEVTAARRNLHQAIYVIRRACDRVCGVVECISFANDCYALNYALGVWRDIDELEHAAAAGKDAYRRGDIEGAAAALGHADSLYAGDFLATYPYDEWAEPPRALYQAIYREAATLLLTITLEHGSTIRSVELARALLRLDPCDEFAYRSLMEVYAATGQRALVASTYWSARRNLQSMHGLKPADETVALAEALGCAAQTATQ